MVSSSVFGVTAAARKRAYASVTAVFLLRYTLVIDRSACCALQRVCVHGRVGTSGCMGVLDMEGGRGRVVPPKSRPPVIVVAAVRRRSDCQSDASRPQGGG